MRLWSRLCHFAFILPVLFVSVAKAETRIFFIANNAEGYGVDRCLATGASCGMEVASIYCRSQQFTEARSFRKINREQVTDSTAKANIRMCSFGCDEFIAIECAR
jgi:hypothetical protein